MYRMEVEPKEALRSVRRTLNFLRNLARLAIAGSPIKRISLDQAMSEGRV